MPPSAGGKDEAWTPALRALWQRIEAHKLPGDATATDFAARLALSAGWTPGFARRAIAQYRRFCFLAVTAATPLTPSRTVDTVWHLHLEDARDYWDAWCGGVLGTKLEHAPGDGSAADAQRHAAQYQATLALYRQFFGRPPGEFWPPPGSAAAGASARWTPEARWYAIAVIAAAAAAAVVMALPGPLAWPPLRFLSLYASLLGGGLLIALAMRYSLRGSPARGAPPDLDALELAFLAGGPARLCDAAIARLMGLGALGFAPAGRLLVPTQRNIDLPPLLRPLREGLFSGLTRAEFHARARPLVVQMRQSLRQRGLLLPRHASLQAALPPAAFLLALALCGVVRAVNGVLHHRPVGYLLLLIAATVAATLWLLRSAPERTLAGDAALRAHDTSEPADNTDLALTVALAGIAALANTTLGPLVQMQQAEAAVRYRRSDGAGSNCGSASNCGGGGSCGGGGCGG